MCAPKLQNYMQCMRTVQLIHCFSAVAELLAGLALKDDIY